MQVGVGGGSNSSSPAPPPARSVGQRIKEASSIQNPNVINNSSTTAETIPNIISTINNIHALCGNNNAHHQSRTTRTTPLCSLSAASAGDSQPLEQHQPYNKQTSTVVLSEVHRNTIRVIGQYLKDLGMNDTVDSLVEESGCRIENSLSARLRDYVVRRAWNKALDIADRLRPSITERQYLAVRVLLLEEKFKDLVARGDHLHALRLLQLDYPKNKEFKPRLEQLATLLMSPDSLVNSHSYIGNQSQSNGNGVHQNGKANIKNGSEWCTNGVVDDKEGNSETVLKVLHKILPPSMMLPPARLQELLKQSWKYQMKHCAMHINPNDELIDERAVLKDHQCGIDDFPARNTQILKDHCSEVWCLEFSPCGRFLASGAKSSCVLIWKVESSQRVRIHRRLQIPMELSGIASLSWSQDSKYLAIASTEENGTGVFIYNVHTSLLVKEHKHFPTDSFSVVSFFHDHSHKLACGDQKGHFMTYDVDRQDDSPRLIEGFRIRCIYSMKDGKTVLASDTHNRIRLYDFESLQERDLIVEQSQIMYFTVDHAERHCLVTTKTEGLRMWCLKTRTLVQSFFGSMHSEFVITSSFGGPHDGFIASGSEDEQIVIWNVRKSQPVRHLTGHTGTVNTVSWNPLHHGMLASGSDDGTIRIWSTKP